MNPYLAETTMPDGSKRRAFFERVPEAKPEALAWEFQIRGDVFGGRLEVVSLAICRVACVDWAKKAGHGEIVFGHSWASVNGLEGTSSVSDTGDVDQDVAQITHAVADALGVAP